MLTAATCRRGRDGTKGLGLLTPTSLLVAFAELAYFTADGILLPALPRYVTGRSAAATSRSGSWIGAFSVSAFFLRSWAGSRQTGEVGESDDRGRLGLRLLCSRVHARRPPSSYSWACVPYRDR